MFLLHMLSVMSVNSSVMQLQHFLTLLIIIQGSVGLGGRLGWVQPCTQQALTPGFMQDLAIT